MRRVVKVFGILAALGVIAGLFARTHPALDSLSILRPMFGAVCLVALVSFTSRYWRLGMALAAGVGLWTLTAFALPAPAPDDSLRVYSKNLFRRNIHIEAIANDIKGVGSDLVLLQELSTRTDGILSLLQDDFPHQHVCWFSHRNAIAVLSRLPFAGPGRCTQTRSMAAIPVATRNGPVWAASVHIPWPWPYNVGNAEAAAEGLLRDLEGPKILGGDFNMVPWSARVRRLAALSQTTLAGPTHATLTMRGVPLPIDHILSPDRARLERRPFFGSDHAGLLAHVPLPQWD